MANVTFVRPELRKLKPLYDAIRVAIAGEPAVKAGETIYLPMPDAGNKSQANRERYVAYLKRAVFYNVTRRTLKGLVGQVFAREPVVKVPSLLDPLVANATGSGISLTQLSKKAVQQTLAFSRCGLFVDYPATEESGGASVADLQAGRIRPTLYIYNSGEVINWRTVDRGAEEILSLVVIFERFCLHDDGFEIKEGGQFRVLRLDEKGEYVHEIWRQAWPTELKKDDYVPNDTGYISKLTFHPRDATGKRMTEIPFMFIGSENNDAAPDDPNFYDLASLNLAHYRNSADYEEACYILGQPTVWASGLTEKWVADVLKGELRFGSSGGIPLPADASIGLLQAEANTMIKEAMDTKERQMVALGAKLVEQKTVQRTATEARMESASEDSTLASTTKNVSAAFLWALKWAARFVGVAETGIEFELNTDFEINRMSADDRRQLIEEWTKGAISFAEMRTGLKRAGSAYEDDAKAKADISKDQAEAMAMAVEFETGDDEGGEKPPAKDE